VPSQSSNLYAHSRVRDAAFEVEGIRAVLLSAVYGAGEELEWVGGSIRSWDAALIEVRLKGGATGLGEVGAAIMAAPPVPGLVAAYRPYLERRRFEHPLDVAAHLAAYTRFWSAGGIASGVAGAIEVACLDAVARREGVPAHALLGPVQAASIEVYASGGLGSTFDDVTAWCLTQVEVGIGTVKFRAMRDPATSIELLRHVSSRLPEGVRFVFDAVQGCAADPWSVEDAIRVGEVAGDLGARWYEEPGHASRPSDYARVRDVVEVPVSGVESYATVAEFTTLLRAAGVDIAQPDVSLVGGAAAFANVATAAAENGVACVPHIWGSGVTLAANVHAAFAHPNVALVEYCTLPNPLRDALLVGRWRPEGSTLAVPDGVGLGVELTPEVEAEYPFRPGGGHVIR
jgi:L-alanine-DL-glutamate epimerase-like enolase superfamily enzyme